MNARIYNSAKLVVPLIACIVMLSALLTGTRSFAQSVEVQPAVINEGDIATLVIELESKIPSLYGLETEKLESDFEILSSESRILSIHEAGEIKRRMQWKLDLVPNKVGVLEIPSLMLGNNPTPVVNLQVVPRDSRDKTDNQIYLELSANPENPYPFQEVTLSLRLLYNTEIDRGRLYEPDTTADVLVLRNGDDRSINVQRNGHAFDGIERKITLFAESEGNMLIPSARFRGALSHSTSDTDVRQIYRTSEPLRLSVQPKPISFTGEYWLPAKHLEIHQSWDRNLENLKPGDTLKRTVTIKATGLAAKYLPENLFTHRNNNFKIYPDQAIRSNRFIGQTPIGELKQSYAMILPEAGIVDLPTLELNWWNTENSTQQQVNLPPIQLKIRTMDEPAGNPASPSIISNSEDTLSEGIVLAISVFFLSAIGFVVLRNRKTFVEWRRITFDPSRQLQTLKSACRENEAIEMRKCLISWASYQWPDRNINGLQQVAEMTKDEKLTEQLSMLDRVLFSHESTSWQGETLWLALINYLDKLNHQSRHQQKSQQPDNYPSAYIKAQVTP